MSYKIRKRTRGGRSVLYVDVHGQRPDGSRYRVERRAPVQDRKYADEFARQLERQLALGLHGKSMTLEDWWPTYQRDRDTNTKPAHAKAVEVAGRLHILPALGSKLLPDIRKEQVEALKGAMLKDKYAPHTINNVLGYLHRCLTLAAEYGKLEKAPGAGLIDYDEEEAEWLEPEEQNRFLEASTYWPERSCLLLLLLDTGLRIGEALAVRNRDIDIARGVLLVRQTRVAVTGGYGRPKEGPTREVHLTARVVGALEKHRSLRDLVFTTPEGKPLTHSMVKRWVDAAAKRAGIAKHVTNHSLRHTRTANLVMVGTPEAYIKAQLGWKTNSVLERYSHLSKSHTAQVMADAEKAIAQLGKGDADVR